MTSITPSVVPSARVRVFVDYWNFQLTINEVASAKRGQPDYRFRLDWPRVGPVLAREACNVVGVSTHTFDGVIMYASHDANTTEGRNFHKWATTWLDRQPGVNVISLERRPRAKPRCSTCHKPIGSCPACGSELKGMIEKGVDTFIATDMIRLAWEGAFDIAVLASSDSDLVPAVEFLNQKGQKIVQAGFPPGGVHLATTCWASFDVWKVATEIERTY